MSPQANLITFNPGKKSVSPKQTARLLFITKNSIVLKLQGLEIANFTPASPYIGPVLLVTFRLPIKEVFRIPRSYAE